MGDEIPTVHNMDIVDALDFYRQHHNDVPDDYTQACADFEMDEAITIKRAALEIQRLRTQIERAREGLEVYADEKNWRDEGKRNFHGQIKYGPNDEGALIPEGPVIAQRILRELDQPGGGDD